MKKSRCIEVDGMTICVKEINQTDYISLTDMVKGFDDGGSLIEKWIRSINTIEFLGVWEILYNPNFKLPEFGGFKSRAGANSFTLSPKKWAETTDAIGIISKAGRHGGGTFAHKDIAFEFGSWLSPQFKLTLIVEFQRLKDEESKAKNTEWDYRRMLVATNYHVHTDAIKDNLIPWINVQQQPDVFVYAEEADLINLAVFGLTARQWREKYPEEQYVCKNLRDCANTNQLIVMANMESLNSMLLRQGIMDNKKRFEILRAETIAQLESLDKVTKEPDDIVSPNKKKLIGMGKIKVPEEVLALQEANGLQMDFGDAISTIANAGKPKKDA